MGIIYKFFNVKSGDYNSIGRVLGCGSKSHGFKSHYSPKNNFLLKNYSVVLNGCLYIKKIMDVCKTKCYNEYE